MTDVNRFQESPSTALGGHILPLHIGPPSHTAPAPGKRRRPRRASRAVLFGLAVAVIAAGAFTAVHVGANLRFDEAAETYQALRGDAVDERSSLEVESESLAATTAAAEQLIAVNTGVLMDAVPLDELTVAIAEAKESSASTDELLSQDPPRLPGKPGWFWELFGAADEIDLWVDDTGDLRDALAGELPTVVESEARMVEVGTTVITTAAAAAPTFEAAHISAKNLDVIALREAAEDSGMITVLDDDAVSRFASLQSAAAKVVASQETEMAEKAGPLLGARLEIEAFARSLAPGVLLEFDWAPIVNGVGMNGSMGGYTTWWWDEPDRSVILLSNSVAEQWPAARSKALVAHEVGHAISVKCEEMYDSSTQDSIEKWATAWAISMGFTDDANGVWAYGYPPESYITAAGGCR